ncbi:6-phosphogluconate dehydrogenase [Winogradskyella aurantia]|uniref:6-phosphogluconate dehydrogenase n=1 Tax=Winogradskyella aurantia TaxID=1915063 RepID=A0A265V0B2_9FLAO|nr:6-phosphogluconate dehydrogenase [Winogradskyella aurantia]OZV71008.1 hypothetical protein CA834_02520 [Winogradskyella aurantia]
MKDNTRTWKSRFKSFLLKVLLGVIVLCALTLWICSWTYSEGTRAGQLIKISEKGVFFKTNEGELNMGGLRMGNPNDGLEGNLWQFSVLDEGIIKELERAEGKRVKLSYKERYKSMPWQGETNYFITNVEVIDY